MDPTEREKTAAQYEALMDLYDLAAPQPKYRELLERTEVVCPMELMAIVASRRAVDATFKDPTTFSSEGFLNLGNTRPLIPLSVDPPRHARYRKVLDPLFAPKRMDTLEADIAQRFNRFVDGFVDRGEGHFTNELATPFPSAVMAWNSHECPAPVSMAR